MWTLWDAELGYGPTSFLDRDRARRSPLGAEPSWGVVKVDPSGARILHAFPHSTLEWRAAEYGIDPEDIDTLLEVILYEPWIPREDDLLAMVHPEASAILRDTRGMPDCWTPGVSDSDRLAAHLARIQAVKNYAVLQKKASVADRQAALDFVGSTRVAPPDPLDPIKTTTRLDPIRIESRKMAVNWLRASGDQTAWPDFYHKPMCTFMGMQPAGGTG
ncbi:hypothetical protein AB0L53_31665 [Nonomuraea sp. NPDC052129]|uniref:hypothetical protein n=1 Tax=Nonomuraea sp. NPDC052129 TaxID=3154651 RepID=UPI00341FD001